MPLVSTLTLTDHFSRFIGGLLTVLGMAKLRERLEGPVGFRLLRRIAKMRNRFLALLEQFRAGGAPLLKAAE